MRHVTRHCWRRYANCGLLIGPKQNFTGSSLTQIKTRCVANIPVVAIADSQDGPMWVIARRTSRLPRQDPGASSLWREGLLFKKKGTCKTKSVAARRQVNPAANA